MKRARRFFHPAFIPAALVLLLAAAGDGQSPKPDDGSAITIEGESLKPVPHPGGTIGHIPFPQSMKNDAPGVFSGDSVLLWRTDWGPASKERMAVNIPITRNGRYQLFMRVGKGPSYGILQVSSFEDIEPVATIDCYAPKLSASDLIDLGTYELSAGLHPLEFMLAGSNPASSQKVIDFSIDYIKVVPVAPIEPAHFQATGADDSSIHSITVGQVCPVPNNSGDTWDAAWTRQGSLYSPSNDTGGFSGAGDGNIMFNKIMGNDPTKLDGRTVNVMAEYGHGNAKLPDGCTWKSSGCMALDGVIYWVVARHLYGGDGAPYVDHDKRQLAHDASFIKSTDLGKTWTRSPQDNYDHPMFPRSRFATPYFVQYGQEGHEAWADASDKYVYALSNNGFWDNGDYVILGRCLRSKMPELNGADWQFYTAGDGAADAAWTSNVYDAKPVLVNPDHLGMTRAVYLPKHQCYLMIGWYYPKGSGKIETPPGEPETHLHTNWDFYVAPHPWGPWRKTGSHAWTPQGFYCPGVCPKFNSADESSVWVLTAGDWRDAAFYRLSAVQLMIK